MFSNAKRILKVASITVLIALLTCTGCASAKKSILGYKKTDATCDLTRMGRNKYFYSSYYQKKLARSVREIKKH